MNGKFAVITGGNSGIGAACARLLAARGIDGVAILDINKNDGCFEALAGELTQKGIKAAAIQCDVTDALQVNRAMDQAVAMFGRIDIAINSAGVLDFNASVRNTSDELWDRTVAVNQTGVFHCCRAELSQMEKQGENGEGAIVNISSVAGVSGNSGAAYSASKHAVLGLSKNIAIRYVGTGIRCNTVCPGPTTTAMTTISLAETGEDGLPNDPRFDRAFTHICHRHVDTSIGFLDAEDQAKAIVFLASEDARAVTGQWIQVDKGFY
jgi:NAD(P)-dependent dehydrogenase (short-subunit alcohol dehydrogenase family)